MKRNLMLVIVFAGMILAGKVTLTNNSKAAAQGVPEFSQADIERASIGLSITPVQVNAGYGRTRFLVGLGSYLVNGVGGCNDCHTNPGHLEGGDPFRGQPQKINAANFLAGGVKFGPFTSRNITPDPKKNNLPAGLTLEQFEKVLRTGEDMQKLHPQISPLLQVMPWPVYSKMTDRDIQAIYLYLSAIPHAEPGQ
ncbi:MAG TPA: cytochrome C [Blastocatellia bacterium]|nr:cytochrome C [Blastocatellia bacterium]HMX27505.1 cytochrome C [Blastocatellia bacterium]HMY73248.1 cytochrome C [Blastocatellia bacterium]HMZ22967.1 cytochrome C [Blastocatellia bacterium]HNG29258.1 cytochrome C [Blastocatellia bacterium]